jgi:hypothetical protein
MAEHQEADWIRRKRDWETVIARDSEELDHAGYKLTRNLMVQLTEGGTTRVDAESVIQFELKHLKIDDSETIEWNRIADMWLE